jgi:cell shape-determining protein MreC
LGSLGLKKATLARQVVKNCGSLLLLSLLGVMLVKRLNAWLGDKLAFWLSTMGCFYLIFALVIVPLFFQHPSNLVGWVQYIVQSIFQGIALPILGFVARISGQKQERVLNETHDAVMDELAMVRNELEIAKEERDTLKELIKELHQISNKIS